MNREHAEFLPAILEIQQSPPLPASRYILWGIILFFSLTVIWASFGRVDIVAVANGKIVPIGQVKVMQTLEAGVVTKLYVEEGDDIEAGDALLQFDTTINGANNKKTEEQLNALKLEQARILSLLDRLDENNASDRFSGLIIFDNLSIELQKNRVRHEYSRHVSQIQILKQEYLQRLAEKQAGNEKLQQLKTTIPLISERASSMKQLMNKNLLPRLQWLEIEEQRIQQVKEKNIQSNIIRANDAALARVKQQIQSLNAEFRSGLLSGLMETENRLAILEQEFVQSRQRVSYQTLKAPVSGRVQNLAVHTIGAVITPAEHIMQIVPGANNLEIEAWILNKDIGFVYEGQAVEIKVETFPFTKYGTIQGEIKKLSNDATTDDNLGLVYAARVKMEKTSMQLEDKIINLASGMLVTVEMNLGKRRLIEYLLTPLLKYRDESARER